MRVYKLTAEDIRLRGIVPSAVPDRLFERVFSEPGKAMQVAMEHFVNWKDGNRPELAWEPLPPKRGVVTAGDNYTIKYIIEPVRVE